MDRLDTLIVFLLVECIKWLPPTDGCTAIGPYLWRLSIESWEEVGTSELAECDQIDLKNQDVEVIFWTM